MAPFLLFSLLFLCGLINSYFFPMSKLYPWLLSFISIPNSLPKPAKIEKKKTMKKAKPSSIAVPPAAAAAVDLESVFATFDVDGDGFITVAELAESLRRLGLHTTGSEVVKMVEKVDANGDGLIDLREFRQLYDSIERSTGSDGFEEDMGLREAFDVFDGNGDGVITVEELGLVLKSMGLKQGEKAEDCRDMIKKVDLDGDGMVDFEEFKKMMTVRGGKFF